ncbi:MULTISPECIES: cytochrome C [unclassified Novosphingobium]|uniref:cytochrome C n=1 Tax=unclassified Novosphingobium TaxID=2644732 RepID=UPI0025FAD802|nr:MULTISPECIES: cytochrome C [unclassified Novosphingobium]
MKFTTPGIAMLFALLMAAAGVRAGEVQMRGVSNPQQARIDYILKCQGCHRPDGGGDDRSNPPIKNEVARFLGVPGGREFLARVPGVSTVDLDDTRLANLVNWTLYTFDPAHMPADFRPYSPEEIGHLRRHPLRLERAETRARLVKGFSQDRAKTHSP